jgi:AraC-like DNA-binding protein
MSRLALHLARHPLRLTTAAAIRTPLSCPTHRHPDIELVVHQGTGGWTTLADGRRFDFAPGSIALYPAHLDHDQLSEPAGVDLSLRLRATEPVPAELTRFHLFPPDALVERGVECLVTGPRHGGRLGRLADDLQATALIARLFASGTATASPRPPADRLVKAAKARLARDHASDISLVEVAAGLGVSPAHLRQVFKTATGMTLVGYLTQVRLEHAKALLRTTLRPLAEISTTCGFANERYFCRVFRRAEGRTPTTFRRED